MGIGWQGMEQSHILCIFSSHACSLLSHWMSLTEHLIKDKIIENFHTVRGEHLSVPWSLGFGVMASPETRPAVNTISS